MKTADFIREHNACREGAEWALSVSDDMADVWDALVEQSNHSWLLWTATWSGVFPDSILRKLACRFVRETPLVDGRTVWDLLTDERSRKAVEVAEAYADGNATDGDLADARNAARAAYSAARAAYSAARDARAACYAARAADAVYTANAAYYAAYAAYYAARAACASALAAEAAAQSAQIKMIAELGNPFKTGE